MCINMKPELFMDCNICIHYRKSTHTKMIIEVSVVFVYLCVCLSACMCVCVCSVCVVCVRVCVCVCVLLLPIVEAYLVVNVFVHNLIRKQDFPT